MNRTHRDAYPFHRTSPAADMAAPSAETVQKARAAVARYRAGRFARLAARMRAFFNR